MSYNILAPSNMDHFFPKHSKEILDWNNRKQLIEKEINIINPNVCFLQEVEQSHVQNW